MSIIRVIFIQTKQIHYEYLHINFILSYSEYFRILQYSIYFTQISVRNMWEMLVSSDFILTFVFSSEFACLNKKPGISQNRIERADRQRWVGRAARAARLLAKAESDSSLTFYLCWHNLESQSWSWHWAAAEKGNNPAQLFLFPHRFSVCGFVIKLWLSFKTFIKLKIYMICQLIHFCQNILIKFLKFIIKYVNVLFYPQEDNTETKNVVDFRLKHSRNFKTMMESANIELIIT